MFFPLPSDPQLTPDFSKAGGLITAIVQDAETLEVLMLAWMNKEAWEMTLKTGEAHYYSRSRKELWHKGATSGHIQHIRAIRLDCDNDAVLLLIDPVKAACHTGARSCFFKNIPAGQKN